MDFRMARPLKDSGRFTIVKESRALNVAREFGASGMEADPLTGARSVSEGESHSHPVSTGWIGLL
jgi:hypothetical protein